MENSKEDGNSSRKARGKLALDNLHSNIAKEDELLINLKISQIYEIGLDESQEIHINYHADRIISLLYIMSKNHGMKYETFNTRIIHLNIEEVAIQISKGIIYERAGLDLLFKELCRLENGKYSDRYINFYG